MLVERRKTEKIDVKLECVVQRRVAFVINLDREVIGSDDEADNSPPADAGGR